MQNDKKNVICTIGTGHGKSVIILALAHTLVDILKVPVYIVTLHPFLSLFGKQKYGKDNKYILRNMIDYLSREDFLYKEPEKDAVVIFDEVD